MGYVIKHFDTPLIQFSANKNSRELDVQILWVTDTHRHLLPLDLEPTAESLSQWLRHRTIPKNRAYVQNFLARCGLNINRPMNIIAVCKGLSLNDCYWVVEDGFDGKFANYNLYDNRFSRILSLIAFTGYGSSIRSSLASCPEFTTNGMLPKCWHRDRGVIKLYKGGTAGAANTGNEPYSEYYAAQIGEAMGIDVIKYSLTREHFKDLCSTCELFTSKDYSFMPVGRLVRSGGFDAVREYYRKLGPEYEKALRDMIVFDAVVCNTDRHFGNFGFLIDNQTNTITRTAPLFDHGNSLFNLAGSQDLSSQEALAQYADALMPCVYDSFMDTAKAVMDDESRAQLRHLLTFRFKRHARYNLPKKRLTMIEKIIRARATALLK